MGVRVMDGQTGTDAVTTRLVSTIASREGVDPTELRRPLYSVVDPDALDALLSGSTGGSLRIEFVYCGYHVTIERDDEVRIEIE